MEQTAKQQVTLTCKTEWRDGATITRTYPETSIDAARLHLAREVYVRTESYEALTDALTGDDPIVTEPNPSQLLFIYADRVVTFTIEERRAQ